MAVYTHYKIPVLQTGVTINLNNYDLNQLVIVDTGDYNYYVVANNTVGYIAVGDAITNGYLVPFPNKSWRENQIVMYSHTDFISPKNLLWLKQNMYMNKKLIKVYINGELFEDWELGGQFTNPAGYTQHLSFPNGYPSGDIKVIYTETIRYGGQYNIRLDRYVGGSRVRARNAMISQTIVHPNYGNMYLESAVMNNDDPTDWTVTYRQFDGTSTYTLYKKFFNTLSVAGFIFNQEFPDNFKLEIWGYDKVTNFNNSGNTGGRSMSRRGSYIPLKAIGWNKLNFDFQSSNPQWGRVNQLKFRFRQVTDDGKVYFSEFFKETLSIKHFPLFTTDATLSEKTYKGNYISLKLV